VEEFFEAKLQPDGVGTAAPGCPAGRSPSIRPSFWRALRAWTAEGGCPYASFATEVRHGMVVKPPKSFQNQVRQPLGLHYIWKEISSVPQAEAELGAAEISVRPSVR